jgi:hypothetical protein
MSKKKKTILLVKIAYLNKNITDYISDMNNNYTRNKPEETEDQRKQRIDQIVQNATKLPVDF